MSWFVILRGCEEIDSLTLTDFVILSGAKDPSAGWARNPNFKMRNCLNSQRRILRSFVRKNAPQDDKSGGPGISAQPLSAAKDDKIIAFAHTLSTKH